MAGRGAGSVNKGSKGDVNGRAATKADGHLEQGNLEERARERKDDSTTDKRDKESSLSLPSEKQRVDAAKAKLLPLLVALENTLRSQPQDESSKKFLSIVEERRNALQLAKTDTIPGCLDGLFKLFDVKRTSDQDADIGELGRRIKKLRNEDIPSLLRKYEEQRTGHPDLQASRSDASSEFSQLVVPVLAGPTTGNPVSPPLIEDLKKKKASDLAATFKNPQADDLEKSRAVQELAHRMRQRQEDPAQADAVEKEVEKMLQSSFLSDKEWGCRICREVPMAAVDNMWILFFLGEASQHEDQKLRTQALLALAAEPSDTEARQLLEQGARKFNQPKDLQYKPANDLVQAVRYRMRNNPEQEITIRWDGKRYMHVQIRSGEVESHQEIEFLNVPLSAQEEPRVINIPANSTIKPFNLAAKLMQWQTETYVQFLAQGARAIYRYQVSPEARAASLPPVLAQTNDEIDRLTNERLEQLADAYWKRNYRQDYGFRSSRRSPQTGLSLDSLVRQGVINASMVQELVRSNGSLLCLGSRSEAVLNFLRDVFKIKPEFLEAQDCDYLRNMPVGLNRQRYRYMILSDGLPGVQYYGQTAAHIDMVRNGLQALRKKISGDNSEENIIEEANSQLGPALSRLVSLLEPDGEIRTRLSPNEKDAVAQLDERVSAARGLVSGLSPSMIAQREGRALVVRQDRRVVLGSPRVRAAAIPDQPYLNLNLSSSDIWALGGRRFVNTQQHSARVREDQRKAAEFLKANPEVVVIKPDVKQFGVAQAKLTCDQKQFGNLTFYKQGSDGAKHFFTPEYPFHPGVGSVVVEQSGTLFLDGATAWGAGHTFTSNYLERLKPMFEGRLKRTISDEEWGRFLDRTMDLVASVDEQGRLIFKIRPLAGGPDTKDPRRILEAYYLLLDMVPEDHIRILGLSNSDIRKAVDKVGLRHLFEHADLSSPDAVKRFLATREIPVPTVLPKDAKPRISLLPMDQAKIPHVKCWRQEATGGRGVSPTQLRALLPQRASAADPQVREDAPLERTPFLTALNILDCQMRLTSHAGALEVTLLSQRSVAGNSSGVKTEDKASEYRFGLDQELHQAFHNMLDKLDNIGRPLLKDGQPDKSTTIDNWTEEQQQQARDVYRKFLDFHATRLEQWMHSDDLSTRGCRNALYAYTRNFDDIASVYRLPLHFQRSVIAYPGSFIGYFRDSMLNLGAMTTSVAEERLPQRCEWLRSLIRQAEPNQEPALAGEPIQPIRYTLMAAPEQIFGEPCPSTLPREIPLVVEIPRGPVDDKTQITLKPVLNPTILKPFGNQPLRVSARDVDELTYQFYKYCPELYETTIYESRRSPLTDHRRIIEVIYDGDFPPRYVIVTIGNTDSRPVALLGRGFKHDELGIFKQRLAEHNGPLSSWERIAMAKEAHEKAESYGANCLLRQAGCEALSGVRIGVPISQNPAAVWSIPLGQEAALNERLPHYRHVFVRPLLDTSPVSDIDIGRFASKEFFFGFISADSFLDPLNLVLRRGLNDGADECITESRTEDDQVVSADRTKLYNNEVLVPKKAALVSFTQALLQDRSQNPRSLLSPDYMDDATMYAIGVAYLAAMGQYLHGPSSPNEDMFDHVVRETNFAFRAGMEELRQRGKQYGPQLQAFLDQNPDLVRKAAKSTDRDIRVPWLRALVYIGVRSPFDSYKPIDEEAFLARVHAEAAQYYPLFLRVISGLSLDEKRNDVGRILLGLKTVMELNRVTRDGSQIPQVARLVESDNVFESGDAKARIFALDTMTGLTWAAIARNPAITPGGSYHVNLESVMQYLVESTEEAKDHKAVSDGSIPSIPLVESTEEAKDHKQMVYAGFLRDMDNDEGNGDPRVAGIRLPRYTRVSLIDLANDKFVKELREKGYLRINTPEPASPSTEKPETKEVKLLPEVTAAVERALYKTADVQPASQQALASSPQVERFPGLFVCHVTSDNEAHLGPLQTTLSALAPEVKGKVRARIIAREGRGEKEPFTMQLQCQDGMPAIAEVGAGPNPTVTLWYYQHPEALPFSRVAPPAFPPEIMSAYNSFLSTHPGVRWMNLYRVLGTSLQQGTASAAAVPQDQYWIIYEDGKGKHEERINVPNGDEADTVSEPQTVGTAPVPNRRDRIAYNRFADKARTRGEKIIKYAQGDERQKDAAGQAANELSAMCDSQNTDESAAALNKLINTLSSHKDLRVRLATIDILAKMTQIKKEDSPALMTLRTLAARDPELTVQQKAKAVIQGLTGN